MKFAPPPAAPPTKKASRIWFWLFLAAGFALMVSLGGNVVLAIVAGARAGGAVPTSDVPGYSAKLIDGEASATDYIGIIPIQGTIVEAPDPYGEGMGSVSSLSALLRGLRKSTKLKGLILMVDSPGGGVTASDRMYHELKRFKDEKKIPIVAVFEDVAASGGYYVSMSADHILAHPTTLTGSVGVISEFYNVKHLMDKVGVELVTIKSLNSQHKESFKDIGSPFREMKPAERAILQTLITEMWERFVSVVQEGRKGKIAPAKVRDLADGRVYTGPQALKLGLVDSVGYNEDAFAKARELAKAPNAKIVRFAHRKGWAQWLEGAESSKFGGPIPGARELIEGPRFMYLWNGH